MKGAEWQTGLFRTSCGVLSECGEAEDHRGLGVAHNGKSHGHPLDQAGLYVDTNCLRA